MNRYVVTEVGTPQGVEVDAANDYHAVAEVAQCRVDDVCLPIWTERVKQLHPLGTRCYMPRDGTGRQWLVTNSARTP